MPLGQQQQCNYFSSAVFSFANITMFLCQWSWTELSCLSIRFLSLNYFYFDKEAINVMLSVKGSAGQYLTQSENWFTSREGALDTTLCDVTEDTSASHRPCIHPLQIFCSKTPLLLPFLLTLGSSLVLRSKLKQRLLQKASNRGLNTVLYSFFIEEF